MPKKKPNLNLKNLNSPKTVSTDMSPVITIDGPTGAGKGTIGKLLAEKLNWHFLDSGAIYRVLALAALQQNIKIDNHEALESLASTLDLEFIDKKNKPQKILFRGIDVSAAIRQEGCGVFASEIAILPRIRTALLDTQRRFRTRPGLVADGRDMGTIVFPDAILKIFLTAGTRERAIRRYQQLQEKGINVSLHDVELDLVDRDMRDEKRIVAPLKPSSDAFIIDATNLSIDEVLQTIIKKINI